MEVLIFQYDRWVGLGLLSFAAYLALRVVWHLHSRGPSLASAPSLLGVILIALVPAWVGLDFLTWRADFDENGVSVYREGLPAVVQTAFTQPSHSIRWGDISSVRFSPGRRGRGGTPPTLSITGAGGTIKFPVEAVGRDNARRLLTLLATCSPDFAIPIRADELVSETAKMRDPFFFEPSIGVSRQASGGKPCP